MKSVWLEWKLTESETWTSSDNDGNKYFMPANQETCTVRTPDGYEGFGWTPEEALSNAEKPKIERSTLEKIVMAAETILDIPLALREQIEEEENSEIDFLHTSNNLSAIAERLSKMIAAERTNL